MSVPASSKLNRFIIDGNFEGSENCSILVEKNMEQQSLENESLLFDEGYVLLDR